MQYYWLYNNDMTYSTSAAMEYLQSLQLTQEEILALQAQVQALQAAQGQTAQVTVDPQMVMEYVQLLQNPNTPDSSIELFFQQRGLTDDQILILQQQAVQQMQGLNPGVAPTLPPAAPVGPVAPGMQAKICPSCGRPVPAGANFCDACGARI
jgi:hypothetical protein